MVTWWLLVACSPCPTGLIRAHGRCVPTVAFGPGGASVPPTEREFWDEFEDEYCDALEDCVCDANDDDTCDVNVDCPRFDWPLGCVYDAEAADDCLDGRFDCDPDPGDIRIEPPAACSAVYVCGNPAETGDTAP